MVRLLFGLVAVLCVVGVGAESVNEFLEPDLYPDLSGAFRMSCMMQFPCSEHL